ncbi:hypothetical protein [Thioalkalivibrio paradoxus]|uniref:Uncharacterized protein n=1 Tax=Thioalkalivibrio paradoxus ARh 1 TaxID=713585 RepID=W0DNW7_9GAMM|nr:hypothetical protein [Thioalkalivibrio paradoxus]AHF00285.1 hypothetical protein THITH_15470 [Thioalkalivibrio paradoxus ARh 1]
MRLLIYVFSGLLMLLGVIGFLPSPNDVHDPALSASEKVLGGILVAWGGALAWSCRVNYRGGLATAGGAFLLGCGVYVSLVPFFMDASQTQASAGVKLAAALLFLVPAVALLALGHRIHLRRSIAAREQTVFLGTESPADKPAASLEGKEPALSRGTAGTFLDALVEKSFMRGPHGEELYHPYGIFFRGRVVSGPEHKARIIKQQKDFIKFGLPVALIYGLWMGLRGPSWVDLFVLTAVVALMQWRQGRLVRGLPVCERRPSRHEVVSHIGRFYPRWLNQLMILNGALLMAMAAAMPWLLGRSFAEITELVAIGAGLGAACALLGVLLLRAGKSGTDTAIHKKVGGDE